MKKVLVVTNIPSPYRVDFYNELGKVVDLTVIFEARSADSHNIKFNYNVESISNFRAIFLSQGDIQERRVDFSIFKYLRPREYDHIIMTSYSYLTEMFGLLYLKLFNIPYYLETDGGLIRQESILKRWYKRFLISGAKGYFSPSKKTDQYLNFYGASENSIYRYPFTSLTESNLQSAHLIRSSKTKLKKQLAINEEKVVLFVGQFIHRKGIDVLLSAFEAVEVENVGLYVIGGSDTDQYESLLSVHTRGKVHFLNFLNGEELANYFAIADVFCLPTREDIWGLVINEAMSYGLPVITTKKCGAGRELVHQPENLIDSEDKHTLCERLTALLSDDSLRAATGKQNFEVIQQYTIENMVVAHQKVLQGE